jgi:formimidoylglutamase
MNVDGPDTLRDALVDESLVVSDTEHTSFRQLCGKGLDAAADADVVIVGVPLDAGTTQHVGTNEGPMAIRQALGGFRTFSLELGIDILEHISVADVGNIDATDWREHADLFAKLDRVLAWTYGAGKTPVVLGGDHSLAYQTVRSFAAAADGPIGLVWVDNHFDCWPPFHGYAYHSGCPLRQLLLDEPKLDPSRVIHVGARGFSNSTTSARNAFELGFRWISAEEFRRRGVLDVVDECIEVALDGTDRAYLTLDVDVADATVAPGTQTPRPGGLFSGDLMQLVRNLSLRGCSAFEVVEVAPGADVRGETALLGAALVMEYLAGEAARSASRRAG